MQGNKRIRRFMFSLTFLSIASGASVATAGDADLDGVDDAYDNCTAFANPLQYDGDTDGIGNRCDPDFNNDGQVDLADLDYLKSVFFSSDARGDLDTSGSVDFADLAILKLYMGAAPGQPPAMPGRRGDARAGLTDGIISVLPASADVVIDDTLTLEVWMDFTADPTIGGGFDILYDAGSLRFDSWTAEDLGDAAFRREPDVAPGELVGIAIGDFDGLSGPALVGTLRFTAESLGATQVQSATTSEPLVGPFVSFTDFMAQEVQFLSADVNVLRLPGPHVEILPESLNFGMLVVGDTTSAEVTVLSVGDENLEMGTAGQVDSLEAPFSLAVDDCAGASLAPNQSCTITVAFSPTAVSSFADSFDVASNALEGSNISVQVAGEAVPAPAPEILISPLTFDFGDRELGTVSTVAIGVSNIGTAPLAIGSVADTDPLAEPFSLQADNCSNSSLAPGNSCGVTVATTPTAEGEAQDSFNVPSNDADEPDEVVSLSVTGIRAVARTVFGQVEGLQNGRLVVCTNNTTGQQVTGLLPVPVPFSCTALGLQADEGDDITILIGGDAE